MPILPGFDTLKEYYSPTKYWGYTVLHWFVLLLYTALTVLVTVNIYKYIIKDKKWKIIPLLFFYILAFISITFREISQIMYVKMAIDDSLIGCYVIDNC